MDGYGGLSLVTCPYDANHIIRNHRFAYHILKCRKNHPTVKLENCVYNFNHLIKPEDFKSHIEMCPNKCRIELNCYDDSSLEHESCQNEYDDDYDEESENQEDQFRLIKPIKSTIGMNEKERSEYIAMQRNNHLEMSNEEFKCDEDDQLPPLQLPKTASIAFQIKKTHSPSIDS